MTLRTNISETTLQMIKKTNLHETYFDTKTNRFDFQVENMKQEKLKTLEEQFRFR